MFLSCLMEINRQEQRLFEYYRRVVKQWGINLKLYSPVRDIKKVGDGFEVITKEGKYKSKNIVIATGFMISPTL